MLGKLRMGNVLCALCSVSYWCVRVYSVCYSLSAMLFVPWCVLCQSMQEPLAFL